MILDLTVLSFAKLMELHIALEEENICLFYMTCLGASLTTGVSLEEIPFVEFRRGFGCWSVYRYALVSDVVELELRPEGSVVAAEPPEVLVGGPIGSG